MNLADMLTGSLTSESAISSLTKKTGGSSKQITALVAMAVPLLIGYLTKNASKKDGATSLLSALGQHKNTNALASQVAEADEEDGAKILQHILGGDASSVIGSLSQETGMDASAVTQALGSITPAMMSGLSAAATSTSQKGGVDLSDGLDMSDLAALMGGNTQTKSSNDLLSGLLGGGSKSSGGLLSGLLGGGGSGAGDLLGGLLGGSAKKSSTDGSDLLGMLSSLMK